MRVAFNARSLVSPVPRGWDRYTIGLVRELVRIGVDVTLLHRAREPLHEPHVRDLGCHIEGLPDRSGLHWEQAALPRALKQGRFDLFHAPTENGVPLLAPCPVVLTIHSVTGHSYLELVRRGDLPGRVQDYLGKNLASRWSFSAGYLRMQIRRADHVLTPSEFCRDEVIRFLRIAPERVTATPLAVDRQFEQPPRPAGESGETLAALGVRRPYLLYVGGYETHKNVGGLLEAFALVHAVRPDLALVLVGSKGVPETIGNQIARLGLELGRNVVPLANLTADLTDLYDDAELLVTLSWRETFCLPALEAMTRGVAVVASAWGAAPEVVGPAGRLVDPRDHPAARNAILALLAEPERSRVRSLAREQSRRFRWSRTAAETLEVYRTLTGASGSGSAPDEPGSPGHGQKLADNAPASSSGG